MPQIITPKDKNLTPPTLADLCKPLEGCIPSFESRSNRPLALTFEDELKMLIFYHLEDYTSGRHLLQVLKEDDFARKNAAPAGAIKTSTFFETINTRGGEQLLQVYSSLQLYAVGLLPPCCNKLGELVAIDGSLIDAVLSMAWADYRTGANKAKIHMGFDINRSIPAAFYLTNGKSAERPFVCQILSPGQTGVMDRGYQCHQVFDRLQAEGKNFVCRIKAGTTKTVLAENSTIPGGAVFYDAAVLLGTPGVNQSKKKSDLSVTELTMPCTGWQRTALI
jgi:hypothetical protein